MTRPGSEGGRRLRVRACPAAVTRDRTRARARARGGLTPPLWQAAARPGARSQSVPVPVTVTVTVARANSVPGNASGRRRPTEPEPLPVTVPVTVTVTDSLSMRSESRAESGPATQAPTAVADGSAARAAGPRRKRCCHRDRGNSRRRYRRSRRHWQCGPRSDSDSRGLPVRLEYLPAARGCHSDSLRLGRRRVGRVTAAAQHWQWPHISESDSSLSQSRSPAESGPAALGAKPGAQAGRRSLSRVAGPGGPGTGGSMPGPVTVHSGPGGHAASATARTQRRDGQGGPAPVRARGRPE